jgi:hypothetical protein
MLINGILASENEIKGFVSVEIAHLPRDSANSNAIHQAHNGALRKERLLRDSRIINYPG